MSMLAERKRKQKWSLNPNGKEWSQDSNKFGQKLLEKMGWQHGKGLGAKEDGLTEHIKVSHKMDSRGMGYKETNDQWTEHESNFTALLAALSGDKGESKPEEIQLKSLEKKSQNSRARVHYHKFTRGKDLSRYSEKDLANIFGKKTLKLEPSRDSVGETEKADAGSKESGSYFSGGSMRDYFKKKLPNFGKINDFIVGNNGVLKKADDSESESEIKPSFGFGFKSEETNSATSHQTFVSYIQEDKTSKRKVEENQQEVFSPAKKHKKDKKQKNTDNLGLSNPAFNPITSPNMVLQKHVLDPIEENPGEYEIQNIDTLTCQNEGKFEKKGTKKLDTEDQNIQVTEGQKKSSKKKKRQTDINQTNFNNDVCLESEADIINAKETSENYIKNVLNEDAVSSDRKKKKKDKLIYDNPNFQAQNILAVADNALENPYEVKLSDTKQKKKKKKLQDINNLDNEEKYFKIGKTNKAKHKSMEAENAGFSDSEDTADEKPRKNPYEVEVKKKKKKSKQLTIQDSNFNSTKNNSTTEENPYEVKQKKLKGKNKALAVENPCFDSSMDTTSFDDTANSSTGNSIIEKNPYEVKPKKEKRKKNKVAVENPCFNDNIENQCEAETKKSKKSKAKAVPVQQENLSEVTSPVTNNDSSILENCDLMLNIVSTPILKAVKTPTTGSVTRVPNSARRKSFRFSDVTQELIIPNNDDLKEMYDTGTAEPKNLDLISKTLDSYQAEMENDINEEKIKTVSLEDIMVGEVGNPHGENETVAEGTKLKFKYALSNAKTPFYQLDKVGAKKSYKHLIKGDIMVKFKNTNLHEIEGYGVNRKTAA